MCGDDQSEPLRVKGEEEEATELPKLENLEVRWGVGGESCHQRKASLTNGFLEVCFWLNLYHLWIVWDGEYGQNHFFFFFFFSINNKTSSFGIYFSGKCLILGSNQ